MTFDEFSRVVQEAFQSIPEAYRKGVEGVTTVETVETHPELPSVVTLGECLNSKDIDEGIDGCIVPKLHERGNSLVLLALKGVKLVPVLPKML